LTCGRDRQATAIAGNWCAGAALDDDLLDIPGYQPSWGWKPATVPSQDHLALKQTTRSSSPTLK
jgi:hypothetical protein